VTVGGRAGECRVGECRSVSQNREGIVILIGEQEQQQQVQ